MLFKAEWPGPQVITLLCYTMSIRFSAKERAALKDGSLATRAQGNRLIIGSPIHPLSKPTRNNFPLVYCASGQTLSHPPTRTPRKPRISQLLPDDPLSPSGGDAQYSSEFLSTDNVFSTPRSVAFARATQLESWKSLIPELVPIFMDLLYRTSSLRNKDSLQLEARSACGCKRRLVEIAVVRWAGM